MQPDLGFESNASRKKNAGLLTVWLPSCVQRAALSDFCSACLTILRTFVLSPPVRGSQQGLMSTSYNSEGFCFSLAEGKKQPRQVHARDKSGVDGWIC